MEPTRNSYSTDASFSAQDRPVSRGLYDFLKSHTNYVWGAGVEIFDPKVGDLHPVHKNLKQDLTAKFVRGEKVKPFVLTQNDVDLHLEGTQKLYFTGSKSADEILVYFDCDCHLPWQDDPDQAVALLRQFMNHLYVCKSPRGRNGYALFRRRTGGHCLSARSVNDYLGTLELALRKLFLYQRINTTIEIKGHVQHVRGETYYCGRLGKLPNFGGMAIEELEQLRATSCITARSVRRFAQRIDQITGISDEAVRTYYKDIRKHGLLPRDVERARPEPRRTAPGEDREAARAYSHSCTPAPPAFSMTKMAVTGTVVGGDSFERGFDICIQMARHLGRVPSVEEVLAHIRDTGQFTGRWDENAESRARRIAYNLSYISRTFDPLLVGTARRPEKPCLLDLTEYLAWAEKQYPEGVGGTTVEEVAVFLAMTKFFVLVDPNKDGSVPYGRFRALWKELYAGKQVRRQFKWERWQQTRDRLVADNVIYVFGKVARRQAQMWQLGPRFPGLGAGSTDITRAVSDPEVAQERPVPEGERTGHGGSLTLCLRPGDGLGRADPEEEGQGHESSLTLCLRPDGDRSRLRTAGCPQSYQQGDADFHRMAEEVNRVLSSGPSDPWRVE